MAISHHFYISRIYTYTYVYVFWFGGSSKLFWLEFITWDRRRYRLLTEFGTTLLQTKLTMSWHQTSARLSLLRVEIENETSQGNFWESRMRMRVLRKKIESREWEWEFWGENESWEWEWDSWFFKNEGLIKSESAFLQTLGNGIFMIEA